jgi:hypothetical protein
MGIRELQGNLKRLRCYGWTWKRIGEACRYRATDGKRKGHSPTWAYLVAKGLYVPSPDIVQDMTRKVEEIMARDLPREKWATTPELERVVLAYIRNHHIGIKRAVKSRTLAQMLGTTDRMVRACVNALRKAGHPICSNVGEPAGFYWPSSFREYKEFAFRDYESRLKDMQRVLLAMDAGAADFFEGQRLRVGQPELITV